MKNKVVTKLLAYMMASAILATTITGGLVMQPVTVMAEEIPDPYGGDLREYEACLAAIDNAMRRMYTPDDRGEPK